MSDHAANGQRAHADEQMEVNGIIESAGAQLAACRQAKGWTVEQVASQLNLAPRQIVAIESDNYAALPGMPVVRGFIRSYAKLLKIDATHLMALVGAAGTAGLDSISPRNTLSMPFNESRLPSMTDRSGTRFKWLVGVLVLLLLAAAAWALQDVSGFGNSGMGSSADSPMVIEQAVEEVSELSPVDANADTHVAATESTPAVPSPLAELTAPAPVSSESVAVALSSVPEPKSDVLELKVSVESWVEIRRAANNSVLLARLMKAGETETIQAAEPLSLVIGNAAGVEVMYKGAPIELKGSTGNVARLTLK